MNKLITGPMEKTRFGPKQKESHDQPNESVKIAAQPKPNNIQQTKHAATFSSSQTKRRKEEKNIDS